MACSRASHFFPAKKSLALFDGALQGKTALVTGGATGLGFAMATTLAKLGARVAIASRNYENLTKAAASLRASDGLDLFPVEMNIRKRDSIAKAFDSIEKEFSSPPDMVVNNAAANIMGASHRLSENAVKSIVETVLLGSFSVSREALVRSRQADKGCSVLCITATYARSGGAYVVSSAMAKAGIETMCKSVAAEWGKYGMRINCIAPGPMYSEGAYKKLSGGLSLSAFVKQLASTIPAGRIGEHEEIGNLAAFVLSDYGSWINGAIIDLDGGKQHLNPGSTSFTNQFHDYTDEQWEKMEKKIRGGVSK